MKHFLTVLSLAIGLLATNTIYSEEINEDDLFSDANNVVSVSNLIDETAISNINNESVSFSGRVYSYNTYNMTRDFLAGQDAFADNRFSSSIKGDVIMDIRLRENFRSYLSVGLTFYPLGTTQYHLYKSIELVGMTVVTNSHIFYETAYINLMLNEFFVDFNINKAAYFRLGKQTLKWGRGYFWNPSDLISIDKNNFLDMSETMEGTYGLKMHLPFGTIANVYAFIDANGVTNIDDFGVAGKLEFLIGGIELSASAWAKKGYYPVYALDFSTRIPFVNVNFWGEASLAMDDNQLKQRAVITNIGPLTVTNFETYRITNQFSPKLSLGLSRSFDFGEITDRISTTLELYYNPNGYTNNVFASETERTSLIINGLYAPNYYGALYIAFFGSFSKFILSDMSLSLNLIGNLSDESFILSTGVSYSPVYNFTVSGNVVGYFGNHPAEYTFSGNGLGVTLNLSYSF